MKPLFLRISDWFAVPYRLAGALVVTMAFLVVGSITPSFTTASTSFLITAIKNSLHIPIYCMLTFVLYLFFLRFFIDKRRTLVLAAAAGFTIGICIEFLQTFTPNRTADFFDIALNLWGILIFITAVHYYWYRRDIIRRLNFHPTYREYQFMAANKEMMMLRERVLQVMDTQSTFVIFITSTFPCEGKTTLAHGLLHAMNRMKPSYLFQSATGRVIDETGAVVTKIDTEADFMQWVQRSRKKEALLIIDGEAVMTDAHHFPAAVVASAADFILWVMSEGRVTAAQFSQAMNLLALPDNKMQGLVFNCILS